MKPGEYVIAVFVIAMLIIFFGTYFYVQYKRFSKKRDSDSPKTD